MDWLSRQTAIYEVWLGTLPPLYSQGNCDRFVNNDKPSFSPFLLQLFIYRCAFTVLISLGSSYRSWFRTYRSPPTCLCLPYTVSRTPFLTTLQVNCLTASSSSLPLTNTHHPHAQQALCISRHSLNFGSSSACYLFPFP